MATDTRLLLTERNFIFKLVTASGLDPSRFSWIDVEWNESGNQGRNEYIASQLVHADTEFYYTFGKRMNRMSPGESHRVQTVTVQGTPENHWRFAVTDWLKRLKQEVDAPDLWGEVLKQKSLAIASSLTPQDEGFSDSQRDDFSAALRQIEGRIVQFHQLTSAQSEAIHDGFEQIKADMHRFGKKDWVSYATGLLFNIMVGAAFAPAAAKDIYNMFVAAVAPLLDVAHKLLQ